MRTLAALCALAAGAFYAAPAHAQLAIDRLWVDVDDSTAARADLVLRNESKDVYYISVTPAEIVDPGTDHETRKTYSDPQELGLLITPNRIILHPDEMRAVRLVSLNTDLKRDRVYRVNITPQIGELEYDAQAQDSRGVALKLLAAFDVLVTVRPKGSQSDLSVRRTGNRLTLSNDGNSNLLLLDGFVCPPSPTAELTPETRQFYLSQRDDAQKSKAQSEEPSAAEAKDKPAEPKLTLDEQGCAKLPGRRLYAGNSWVLAAAPAEYLKFQSRRNAAEDFRPIEIRCGSPAGKDSELCRRDGRSDADVKAAELSHPTKLSSTGE